MTPGPIIFRQHRTPGGEIVVFVAQEWPECAVIAVEALRLPQVSINDDGLIVIRRENGYGAYKLAKEQKDDQGITVELSDGSFSEPPDILPIPASP